MLKNILRKVVKTLDSLGVPCALIGALATAVHGVVRATDDVDLLAGVDIHDALSLEESLNQRGLDARFRRGTSDDPLPGLIRIDVPLRGGRAKADLLFPASKWQVEAVLTAKSVDLGGFSVRVVSAADLFLLKLIAGGPQDLLDAAAPFRL